MSVCVRTCVCARVCMRACVCACVCARARARMCGFARNVDLGYAHVPTSALGACACKCTCTGICVCTCVCAKLGVYGGGGGGGSRCWICMALLSGVRKDSVAVALQFRRCMWMRICEPHSRHKKNCQEVMTVHYIVCVHANVCRCILPFMRMFFWSLLLWTQVTTSKCMPSPVAGFHASTRSIYTKSYYVLVVLQWCVHESGWVFVCVCTHACKCLVCLILNACFHIIHVPVSWSRML